MNQQPLDLPSDMTAGKQDAAGSLDFSLQAMPQGTDAAFQEAGPRALAHALSQRMHRWAISLGARRDDARAAAQAAWRLSMASSEGHVCMALDNPALGQALVASRVVQRPSDAAALPMVLDAQSRLYFHRAFDDERQLARRLAHAQRAVTMPALGDAAQAKLHALFPKPQGGSATDPSAFDRQQVAVALALLQPVVVISGGPGTGKTTTLAKLLACVFEQTPKLRVGLAATTGKAASRMTAALAHPTLKARTVHAWLGTHPHTGHARYDANHPLPLDMLVVDEASMLDLALARRLLDALPSHARIILLGDKDQLAAVDAGAVFAELADHATMDQATLQRVAALCGLPTATLQRAWGVEAAATRVTSPLGHGVVWLTHSHRFAPDSGIGQLAALVRDGDSAAACALLGRGGGDLAWVDVQASLPTAGAASSTSAALVGALTKLVTQNLEPYAQALAHAASAPTPEAAAQALAALDAFRLLCAVREGPCGTHALNRMVAAWLQRRLDQLGGAQPTTQDGNGLWHLGRAVMITRNDAALGLSNGDVGIALPPSGTLPWRVALARRDGAGGNTIASVPIARLTHVESAFATTVHKAQGSEFHRVAIVLPTPWQRPCSRELLYTAITRARQHVTVLASLASVGQTIDTRTRRVSGLADRLLEAAQENATQL